eukprot:4625763-Prymnesium_polylepis.1
MPQGPAAGQAWQVGTVLLTARSAGARPRSAAAGRRHAGRGARRQTTRSRAPPPPSSRGRSSAGVARAAVFVHRPIAPRSMRREACDSAAVLEWSAGACSLARARRT